MKKLILLLFVFTLLNVFSQNDSVKVTEKKINRSFLEQTIDTSKINSPKKAGRLAAVAPFLGLGQIYNKVYWKLPIVYGGGAFFTYRIITLSQTYSQIRDEVYRRDIQTAHPKIEYSVSDPELALIGTEALRTQKDLYRRRLDRTVLYTGLFYGFTIVDAIVDAHMKDFKIDRKKAISFYPSLIPNSQTASLGFRMRYNF